MFGGVIRCPHCKQVIIESLLINFSDAIIVRYDEQTPLLLSLYRCFYDDGSLALISMQTFDYGPLTTSEQDQELPLLRGSDYTQVVVVKVYSTESPDDLDSFPGRGAREVIDPVSDAKVRTSRPEYCLFASKPSPYH